MAKITATEYDVTVFHVGGDGFTHITDADFHEEGAGNVVVNRGSEIVALFAAGKWSGVVKHPCQP